MSSSVFDRFVVSGVPRPIPERHFASGTVEGVPYPASYLRFVRRFGYGLAAGRFRIHPPLSDFADSIQVRAPGIKWALETVLRPGDPSYDFQYAPDGSSALVAGLVGFATGENGESLFWATSEASAGEYPIYVMGRPGLFFGGASLEQFFERISSRATVKQALQFTREPLPLTFEHSASRVVEPWLR